MNADMNTTHYVRDGVFSCTLFDRSISVDNEATSYVAYELIEIHFFIGSFEKSIVLG